MSDDPLSNPLNELGHISVNAKQLSQSMAQLAAGAGHVSRDLQHGTALAPRHSSDADGAGGRSPGPHDKYSKVIVPSSFSITR